MFVVRRTFMNVVVSVTPTVKYGIIMVLDTAGLPADQEPHSVVR